MSTERIVAATRGVFQGIEIVTRHMADRAIPLLQAEPDPTERERRLKDLYMRVFCWLQTLNKLSDPRDAQAIVTCNRSLFESTVDIILLSQGTGSYAPERMYWWEKSAKLVAAEALVRYFTEAQKPIPAAWQAQVNFIKENQAEILKKRLELWPRKDNKPKHPMRWTGSPDLLTDARSADQLRQAEISQELETSLTEFHETQLRRMNFTVHGSALALERYLSINAWYVVCGISYKWSTDLAMFATRILLTDFGLTSRLPELINEWGKIDEERTRIYKENLPDLATDSNLGDE